MAGAKPFNISVIGTGYVGLVTGTCLAETGNNVTCIDVDTKKVERMNQGQVPIYEPGLEELFTRNLAAKKLRITTNLADGIKDAEIIFLGLPTPPGEDGSADLSYVLAAAEKLGKLLDHYALIVNKSTVPVGTTQKIRERISKHAKVPFDVASNPEFLREGHAVSDFMQPDRIVVGTNTSAVRATMQRLYAPFVAADRPLLFMDESSAELTKYAANAFLAVKISFMNEIAALCETVGANVDNVRQGIGHDPRIGTHALFPGLGYGGSCLPKDTRALRHTAMQHGSTPRILEAAMTTNTAQQDILPNKIMRYFDGNVRDKTFALWGIAFKPETDDIREAPALGIIHTLTQAGAHIIAYDPQAAPNAQKLLVDNQRISFAKTATAALTNADALIIATEWNEFCTADLSVVAAALKQPAVFDGRNIYTLAQAKKSGLRYESIGRPIVKP